MTRGIWVTLRINVHITNVQGLAVCCTCIQSASRMDYRLGYWLFQYHLYLLDYGLFTVCRYEEKCSWYSNRLCFNTKSTAKVYHLSDKKTDSLHSQQSGGFNFAEEIQHHLETHFGASITKDNNLVTKPKTQNSVTKITCTVESGYFWS